MKKKISLVTGGAGFLGSFLCEKLINKGNSVICLDNLFTGSIENIRKFEDLEDFKFINHDVTDPIDLEVDEIFNLACPASPKHYQHDPLKTIKTNVLGSINMLELSKKLGCKILQASTSEIYGDPEEHPQSENYWGRVNPIGVRSCYDEGKRCAETLFFDYQRKYKIDIKVARIFNTYGPKMSIDDGRVVSNLIVQAINSENMTIYGNGNQTRSFCYVDDLIDGLSKFMDSEYHGPINLGNPNEMSINEIANIISKITKTKSDIVNLSLPEDDPTQRKPDITKATKLLNWVPKISFESGINKTINYFKEKINK